MKDRYVIVPASWGGWYIVDTKDDWAIASADTYEDASTRCDGLNRQQNQN